jgi:tetratricopeptide (TPR) repeat protein
MQNLSIDSFRICRLTLGLLFLPLLAWNQIQEIKGSASIQEKMIEAKQLALLGNYPKAIDAFEKLFNQYSDIPAISYELARLYALEGPVNNAVKYAREAYQKESDNTWYASFYAKLLKDNNLHFDAIQLLEKLLEDNPNQTDLYVQLAFHYNAQGNPNQAFDVLENYAQKIGWNYDLFQIAMTYAQQFEKPKNIEKRLQEFVSNPQANPQYFYLLADFYKQSGNIQKEKEVYKQIIQKFPYESKAKLALLPNQNEIANTQEISSNLNPIINDISIELDQKIKSIIPYVQELVEQPSSEVTFQLLNLVESLKIQYPNEGKVYSLEGDLHRLHGDYDLAIAAFKKATELNPEILSLWDALLNTYLQTRQYLQMKEAAETAMGYFPFQYQIYYQAATACFHLNKYDLAQSHLALGQTLIEKESIAMALFLVLEGDILFQTNMPALALNKWKEAVNLGYENPALLEKIKANE